MSTDKKMILKIIEFVSNKYPELRFGQILYSLNIYTDNSGQAITTDAFYNPDKEILDRIYESSLYKKIKTEFNISQFLNEV